LLLDDPVLGLALFLVADAAGAVPTLRNTWRDLRKEAAEPWLLSLAASAINLALVGSDAWTLTADGFAIWAFPVYLTILNGGTTALIARGRSPVTAAASLVAALPS
jgi:hypothetical protein